VHYEAKPLTQAYSPNPRVLTEPPPGDRPDISPRCTAMHPTTAAVALMSSAVTRTDPRPPWGLGRGGFGSAVIVQRPYQTASSSVLGSCACGAAVRAAPRPCRVTPRGGNRAFQGWRCPRPRRYWSGPRAAPARRRWWARYGAGNGWWIKRQPAGLGLNRCERSSSYRPTNASGVDR